MSSGVTTSILVVEDEPHVLELVQNILATIPTYSVICAKSMAEGLHIGFEHPHSIDLLVANVILDGGALGTDLATRLKRARPELKVMLINGKDRGELEVLQRACLQQGWQLLDKEFVERDLLERIRAELGGMTAPAAYSTI